MDWEWLREYGFKWEVAADVENTHVACVHRRHVSSENKVSSSIDHSQLKNVLKSVITWRIHLYTR
jgi:hypothetical protein